MLEQVIDDACEFVSRGGDRLSRALAGAQAAVIQAQSRMGAPQRLGRQPQRLRGPVAYLGFSPTLRGLLRSTLPTLPSDNTTRLPMGNTDM